MPAIKRQASLRTFGRVSKATASPALGKSISKQSLALSVAVCPATKRKRDDSDNEDAPSQLGDLAFDKIFVKKQKVQLPSPPSSRPPSEVASPIVSQSPSSAIEKLSLFSSQPPFTKLTSTVNDLPAALRDLLSLHECLLKALAIHYAHNGPSAPAELLNLCKTVTCLWKKRRVAKEDIQRALALYELAADTNVAISEKNTIDHKKSPFKLMSASTYTCLEYVGANPMKKYRGGLNRSPFNEKCLQSLFKSDVMSLFLTATIDNDTRLAFLDGPVSRFPLLACEIGQQTEQRIAKASAARTEILDVAAKSQIRQNAKLNFQPIDKGAPEQTGAQVTEQIKSRTQSLFDRVKAKQLANTASTVPTAENILRRHAIGRIAEVVEILRMKQSQKLSAGFRSDIHDSPSKIRPSKVSFSYSHIIHEVKNSASVPIGDEETRMCLQLLSREVEGFWVTTFELGSVKSVVLQGMGRSGREVQKQLEEMEKLRERK